MIRIAQLDADKHYFLNDPKPFLEQLRSAGVRIDLFTFLQKPSETSPQYSYAMEWDNLAVLPVTTYEHWWKQQIRSYPRNRARQAEKKGVILREVAFDSELVRGIWEIYNECPVRQGRAFRHYGKDLATVYKEEATFLDSSIFIGAFLHGKLIGFVKLVTDEERTQANLMNIVAMVGHRDKAPTNALIAHSVRVCAERRIPNLVYQSFVYGKKQPDSLSHFKEINGFERVDLPRYYVPLTSIGWVAFRLGLHKRLSERLPASVSNKFREWRAAWYNRRFSMADAAEDKTACPESPA